LRRAQRRDIAGYRNDRRHFAGRELCRLRLRALAWRIEHDHVVIAQLLRINGRRNRSRVSAFTVSSEVEVAAFCNAVTAPASLSNAVILAFAANRSANGRPAKEISDVLGALAAVSHQCRQRFLPATSPEGTSPAAT